jgi:hypothetical protein
MSYRASCHGKDRKGNPPVARRPQSACRPHDAGEAQWRPVSDQVTSVLRRQAKLCVHGESGNAGAGAVFRSKSQAREEIIQLRIANLNRYFESLQENNYYLHLSGDLFNQCIPRSRRGVDFDHLACGL